MSASQEQVLWQQYQLKPDQATREALFELYREWAEREARSIHRQVNLPSSNLDEFRQWAYEGLLEAIDGFDPGRKFAFKTYAKYRVKGAIYSALPNLSEDSRYYAERGRLIEKDKFQREKRRDEENLKDVEPISQLVSMALEMAVEVLLQEPDADLTLLRGEFYSSPEIGTIAQRIRDQVQSLAQPMQSIMTKYYFEELPFERVAEDLSLSRSRVSQLHKKAIVELKARVGW